MARLQARAPLISAAMTVQTRTKNIACRPVSPDTIKRQRTALVSLSLVLLIFALAGGSMKSDVTLLNLPLTFKRPAVLLAAAWAIWLYFLYRYVLVTESPWKWLVEEVHLHALADRRVQALSLRALDRFELSSERRADALRHLSEGWTFAIEKENGIFYFNPGRIFRPSTQPTAVSTGQTERFRLTRAEIRTYRVALVRGLFRAIALENTFSEVILPYLLVAITPLTWVILYWQTAWKIVRS